MVGILGVYVLYCVGVIVLVVVIGRGLPYLVIGLGLAAGFILGQIGLVLSALLRGVVWCACQAGSGIYLGTIFLCCLAYEWWRGPEEVPEPVEEEFSDPEEDPPEKEPLQIFDLDLSYFFAVSLLGLPNGFTQADLALAYKQAIRKAHPDAGGSVEAAQEVNAARDLIMHRMGWK